MRDPSEWLQSGYNEIQNPPERYHLIKLKRLCELTGFDSIDSLRKSHRQWIDEALHKKQLTRDDKWTDCLAVGSQKFTESYLDAVGIRANGRQVKVIDDCHVEREKFASYNDVF